MKSNDNHGAGLVIGLVALLFVAVVTWVRKTADVPIDIAMNSVVSFVVWGVLFLGALYARLVKSIDVIDFSYPIFTATLWEIFIPFLDHWAKGESQFSPYADSVFYGELWFQWGISVLIFCVGYFLVFRMRRNKYSSY